MIKEGGFLTSLITKESYTEINYTEIYTEIKIKSKIPIPNSSRVR